MTVLHIMETELHAVAKEVRQALRRLSEKESGKGMGLIEQLRQLKDKLAAQAARAIMTREVKGSKGQRVKGSDRERESERASEIHPTSPTLSSDLFPPFSLLLLFLI